MENNFRIKKTMECTYKSINKDLQEKEPKKYDLLLIYMYGAEVEDYLMLDSIEFMEDETRVKYVEVEDFTEAKEYTDKVNKMIREYNEKYNENMMELVLTVGLDITI